MHPKIESILERPLSHRIVILVVTISILLGVFWIYFYSPKSQEHTKLEESIEDLKSKITTEQRLAMNLNKFRDEVKQLNVKFKFALAELPDQKEIPDLLSSVSNLARDAGLEVNLFKPRAENFKEFFAEVPVEVDVSGSYHQVASFFDEVGHLDRIVNISDISIRDPLPKDEFVEIKVGCVATTFRYLDEEERKRSAAASSDKSKKKRR